MLLKARINDDEISSLDPDSVTSREFKVIKAHTGLGMVAFWNAVERMGANDDGELQLEILDTLHWLMLKRAGIATALEASDDYSPANFIASIMELNEEAIQAAAEAEDDDPKVSDPTSDEPKSI